MLRSTVSFLIAIYSGTFLSFKRLSNCIGIHVCLEAKLGGKRDAVPMMYQFLTGKKLITADGTQEKENIGYTENHPR